MWESYLWLRNMLVVAYIKPEAWGLRCRFLPVVAKFLKFRGISSNEWFKESQLRRIVNLAEKERSKIKLRSLRLAVAAKGDGYFWRYPRLIKKNSLHANHSHRSTVKWLRSARMNFSKISKKRIKLKIILLFFTFNLGYLSWQCDRRRYDGRAAARTPGSATVFAYFYGKLNVVSQGYSVMSCLIAWGTGTTLLVNRCSLTAMRFKLVLNVGRQSLGKSGFSQ